MRPLPTYTPTVLAHLFGWLPPALLAIDIASNGPDTLGANPVEYLSHYSGEWALRFLILTLSMTPLRMKTGWRWPLTIRRALGLYCFALASTHLLIYWLFDLSLAFSLLAEDLAKRPYILLGSIAWLSLLPLAITSTRGWQKRLGRRWKKLHRLTYVAAGLAAVHFLMQPKTFEWEPWIYTAAIAALLAMRLPTVKKLIF